jgi:shikimate kinase/3-dehydroquinate synthase
VKDKVYLFGYPAVGKTTVGKELAERLKRRFIDLDLFIESKTGKLVKNLIRVEGEESFRAIESQALHEIASLEEILIVSLGGGATISEQNRKLISSTGIAVCLKAQHETIAKRALEDDGNERPLLVDVVGLIKSREAFYSGAELTIWTDYSAPNNISKVIADSLVDELKGVVVPFEYEQSLSTVYISPGIFNSVLTRGSERAALVVDKNVKDLWDSKIDECFKGRIYTIDSGETSKRLSQIEIIAEKMLKDKVSRDQSLIVIGGGVAGDIGGLLASLYARGMNLVQVPTTVVSQVDSAIGGKTGVNLVGGKNMLGTFYPAAEVFCDVSFFSTLPQREFISGLAEVIKYGVISSIDFFDWIEKNVDLIKTRDEKSLLKIIEESILTKCKFVSGDLKDLTGQRARLNFGHTVGHAIEKLTNYQEYLHGEAISIGMVYAARLSVKLGRLSPDEAKRIERLLESFGLPVELPDRLKSLDAEIWFSAIEADKKRMNKEIGFITISKIGESHRENVQIKSIVELIMADGRKE